MKACALAFTVSSTIVYRAVDATVYLIVYKHEFVAQIV